MLIVIDRAELVAAQTNCALSRYRKASEPMQHDAVSVCGQASLKVTQNLASHVDAHHVQDLAAFLCAVPQVPPELGMTAIGLVR